MEVKELQREHFNSYKEAILQSIDNNTNALVEDITSIIKKPPLDSMDVLQTKFLNIAKKNKEILDIEQLNMILNDYRMNIISCSDKIKSTRIKDLSKKVDSVKFSKDETINFYKKDFIDLNKKLKKILKEELEDSIDKIILKNINKIFKSDNQEFREELTTNISKYLKTSYNKQVLDSFDIKVLVKDTTLINVVKEQTDRYLFTLNNSRLFNNLD